MLVRSILFILFTLLNSCIFSQQLDLSFRHLGEEEGLVDNRYNIFLTKGSKGFVWISSMEGCYRFDGKMLKSYLLKDVSNYSDNIQSSFFEDANADLWFTTENALFKYDRRRDRFESQQLYKDSLKLDSGYHAFHINKRAQKLWICAGGYMWAYNIEEKRNGSDYLNTSGKRFLVDTLENGEAYRIFAFPWFNKPGFEFWPKSDDSFGKMEYHHTGILNRLKISNGYVQNDSIIWLITNEGLVEYNYANKIVKELHKPKEVNEFSLWDGLLLKENQLLVSSPESGLWSFDLIEKKLWKQLDGNRSLLSSDSPKELYLDYQNQLWITHYSKGLDYTTSSKLAFFNPLEKMGIVDVVQNIEEDEQKRIWVLTRDNGIFVFNLNQDFLYHYNSIGKFTDFSSAQLNKDGNGKLWLTIQNHIYYFDSLDHLDQSNWRLIQIADEKIFALNHVKSKEDKLFVVTANRVYELLKKGTKYTLIEAELFKGHNEFEFYNFYPLNDTINFLPYRGTEIWILKQKDQSLSFYNKFDFNAQVFDILESSDSTTIWIASNKGLFEQKVDTKGLTFVENEIMHSLSISSIVEDLSGKLWLPTNDGLYLFKRINNEVFRFSDNNGLANNLFFQNAALLDSKGNIWLGNEKGLTVFNPDSIQLPLVSTSAYIDNIWVNNKELDSELNINELEKISFPYNENTLAFSLKTIGISQSKNSTIQFRLKNYDDNWATSMKGGLARFTKIPHGEYILEAIPIDENNKYGQKKQLNITISIPFWKTLWFKMAVLAGITLLMAIGFGIYFYNQLRKQKRLVEKQKMINAERNRIGKELHDDMGGGLSTILFISEDLKHDEKDTSKIEQTERISALTQNALTNMRDIIWALDTDQNTLKDLIARFQSYSATYLSDHYITLDFNINSPKSGSIELGSETKRNLFLILKECLHNIVKHAKANQVFITIIEHKEQLHLDIKDNGIGFNPSILKVKGNGLENLKFRTKTLQGNMNIQSDRNKGTLLSFVYSGRSDPLIPEV